MRTPVFLLVTLLLSGCWFQKEVLVTQHLPIPQFMLEPCTPPVPIDLSNGVSLRDLGIVVLQRQSDHLDCVQKMDRIIQREKSLDEQEKAQKK